MLKIRVAVSNSVSMEDDGYLDIIVATNKLGINPSETRLKAL